MKEFLRISILGICVAGIMAAGNLKQPSEASTPGTHSSEEISWNEFCKARGYDIHDQSDEIINEYLDTWVGTVEEEHAFNNLPAQE